VFDADVVAIRVATQTGMVGLRRHGEAIVLALVPGLVVVRTHDGERFAATAGGLLDNHRTAATLLTPYAVVSSSEDEILAVLAEMFATPDTELTARRKLAELERRILDEVRGSAPNGPRRPDA
jgi:F0F1-type ATP synthase epsilon subunit